MAREQESSDSDCLVKSWKNIDYSVRQCVACCVQVRFGLVILLVGWRGGGGPVAVVSSSVAQGIIPKHVRSQFAQLAKFFDFLSVTLTGP